MSLQTIQVPFASFQFALWDIPTGLDSQTPPQPAPVNGETATIDDATNAYIAVSGGQVACVLRQTASIPAGGSLTVNVTMNGFSANGTALPAVVQPVTFAGPPLPPQAATLVVTGQQVGVANANGSNVPADPGTATISI